MSPLNELAWLTDSRRYSLVTLVVLLIGLCVLYATDRYFDSKRPECSSEAFRLEVRP